MWGTGVGGGRFAYGKVGGVGVRGERCVGGG